jgi:carboxylesterase
VLDAPANPMVYPPAAATIIKGAEPFRFDVPSDVACLLVHGFTGTPGELRELGQFLAEQGIASRGVLLRGHGTRPQDLAASSFRDWVDDVEAELDSLLAEGKRVFLCGLSMGGTLTLNVAARRSGDPRLAGVISLAAPLRIVNWRLHFLPLVGLVRRWQRWSDPDIKDRAAWERHLGYRAFPIQALRQLLSLLRDTRGRVAQVNHPLLILHSRADHTVAAFNAELIHRTVASEHRKLVWLENSFHVVTLDFDADQVRNEVLTFIREHA